MTEPYRLLDKGVPLERELLASAAGDRPDPARRAAVAAALGLGVQLTGTTSASAASVAPAEAGALAAAAPAGSASLSGWLVAAAIVGSVIGSVAIASAVVRSKQVSLRLAPPPALAPPPPAHSPGSSALSPAPPALAPPAEVRDGSSGAGEPPGDREPVAPALPTAPRAARPVPAPYPGEAPAVGATTEPGADDELGADDEPGSPGRVLAASLAVEVKRLDEVRLALRRDDPRLALEMLELYFIDHPHGELRPEASSLRVEALLGKGDRLAAEARAAEVYSEHGDNPVADRVRELLAR